MTEPMVTIPLSQYNKLVDAAQANEKYVLEERKVVRDFVLELADRAEARYRLDNPVMPSTVPELLRKSLSAFFNRQPNSLPKAAEIKE